MRRRRPAGAPPGHDGLQLAVARTQSDDPDPGNTRPHDACIPASAAPGDHHAWPELAADAAQLQEDGGRVVVGLDHRQLAIRRTSGDRRSLQPARSAPYRSSVTPSNTRRTIATARSDPRSGRVPARSGQGRTSVRDGRGPSSTTRWPARTADPRRWGRASSTVLRLDGGANERHLGARLPPSGATAIAG